MNGSSDGNSDLEDSCSERQFWFEKRLSRWRRRRGLDSRCPGVRARSRGRAGFLPNSQPNRRPVTERGMARCSSSSVLALRQASRSLRTLRCFLSPEDGLVKPTGPKGWVRSVTGSVERKCCSPTPTRSVSLLIATCSAPSPTTRAEHNFVCQCGAGVGTYSLQFALCST